MGTGAVRRRRAPDGRRLQRAAPTMRRSAGDPGQERSEHSRSNRQVRDGVPTPTRNNHMEEEQPGEHRQPSTIHIRPSRQDDKLQDRRGERLRLGPPTDSNQPSVRHQTKRTRKEDQVERNGYTEGEGDAERPAPDSGTGRKVLKERREGSTRRTD